MENNEKLLIGVGAVAIVIGIFAYNKKKKTSAATAASAAVAAQQQATQIAQENSDQQAQRQTLTTGLVASINSAIAANNATIANNKNAVASVNGGQTMAVSANDPSVTSYSSNQAVSLNQGLTKLLNTVQANIMTLDELNAVNNEFLGETGSYVGTLSTSDIQNAFSAVLSKYHITLN